MAERERLDHRPGPLHPARRLRPAATPLAHTSRARPWWATALAAFCAGTIPFLFLRDLLIPEVRDVEVWLGLELRGTAALATAPLHYAIFALGAVGFWRCRPWVWPWASVYALQIAFSHLVWNLTSPRGEGLEAGLVQLGLFSVPALLLYFARPPAAPPNEVVAS